MENPERGRLGANGRPAPTGSAPLSVGLSADPTPVRHLWYGAGVVARGNGPAGGGRRMEGVVIRVAKVRVVLTEDGEVVAVTGLTVRLGLNGEPRALLGEAHPREVWVPADEVLID